MKILPAELGPPSEPTTRRHQPPPVDSDKGWQNFRSCLRWDFGFTCGFCLLHETDYSPSIGAAGTGQMSIEHHIPQSADPALRNQYANCLYACTSCNRARSRMPVVDGMGRRLLEPSRDAWGEHFFLDGSRIRPRDGNIDASYTWEAYDIDAPDKIERRRFRSKLYADRLPLFAQAPDKIERVLAKAEQYRDTDREIFYILLDGLEELRQSMKKARTELSWYPSVPPDAPTSCRCTEAIHHSLPSGLARQMIDLP